MYFIFRAVFSLFKLTILLHGKIIRWIHTENISIRLQQMKNITQLFSVDITVNKNLKFRVSSLGLPGLNVQQIHMLLLWEAEGEA